MSRRRLLRIDKKDPKSQAAKDTESLEKMLADTRQRIMEGRKTDYEKEVAAFADKYSRMYEVAKPTKRKLPKSGG